MAIGREPIPTALRLIEGNRSKRPLRDPNPTPPVGCQRPKFLTGRPAEVWNELAPRLAACGILTELDQPMLAAFCILISEMEDDPLNFKKYQQLRQYASCFGMSPDSRSRLSVSPLPSTEPPKPGRGYRGAS
jgi:phage terminase small subunit